jgi:hypothetical protein
LTNEPAGDNNAMSHSTLNLAKKWITRPTKRAEFWQPVEQLGELAEEEEELSWQNEPTQVEEGREKCHKVNAGELHM